MEEEDSHFLHQRINPQFQANPTNKGKPCSNFLFKFLPICLFLALIPLFPTDPPKFFKGTIFGPTWELIHLLIIGIVVSYGLFCRLSTPQVPPKPQNENPFENIAIPTQTWNFSYYRNEPYGAVRREDCERPLGLPVRSLRSRVLDSDDTETESPIGKDRIFEQNVGGLSPISWESRPIGVDFMGEDSKYEMNQPNSQSFRSNVQGLYQKNQGFRGSWMKENFETPVSGFSSQVCDSNVIGIQPSLGEGNFDWEVGKFYMHSTEPVYDYGSMRSHETVYLGEPSIFENGSLGGDKTGVFTPSAATPTSFPGPERNFAPPITPSRSRKCSNEDGDLGSSEKNSLFMPSTANAPSASVADSDFTSSVKQSRSRKIGYENGDLGKSPKFKTGNLGDEKARSFVHLDIDPSSLLATRKDIGSSVKQSRSRKIGHENGDLGSEKTSYSKPSPPTVDPSPSSAHGKGLATSVRRSRSRKFFHEDGESCKSTKSENVNLNTDKVDSFMPTSTVDPSTNAAHGKGLAFSVRRSRSRKFNLQNGNSGESTSLEDVNLATENTNSFLPSSTFGPSLNSAHGKSIATSVRRSRSRKFNLQNGDSGEPISLEDVNLATEKTNSVTPSSLEVPSVMASGKGFAPSNTQEFNSKSSVVDTRKDEQGLKGGNVSPDGIAPFSVPTPTDDFDSLVDGPSLNKDKPKPMPTRWHDGCFVIPSLENNDVGILEQEKTLREFACSPEPPSAVVSSSMRSTVELASSESKEAGNDLASSLTNTLEIEELGEKNDNYKPSTPSPPPRRNDIHFPSSVESSCNTLAIGSFDDEDEVGSPPAPERGKTLLKTSLSQKFGCVAFFDRDQRKRGSKGDHAKEENMKVSRGGKSCGWDCLKLDVKPSFSKSALKGKSVRTIKPPQEEVKIEENGERKGEKGGMVIIKIGISEKKSTSSSNSGSNDQKQEKGTTSITVGLNSKENCKDKTSDTKEEETDSEEIDRKAAEFIAKFKEQIRLQKVTARAESNSRCQQQPRRNSSSRN